MNPRRQQLVDAAQKVLLHYGPRKTTINDIARAAGVAVGTVYLEFSSKAALLAAVYETRLVAAERSVAAALREADLAQAMRAAFDARTRVYFEMGRGGAHAKEVAKPFCASVKTVWRAHRERICNLVEVRLAGAVEAPQQVAEALMTAYASFEPSALNEDDWAPIQARLDGLHALVGGGLS